ncbi:MAG: TetR/AcrR family transcriptional regulator [Candidatus Dadabacteria bacterium]|nr:TetR/AcrR family transcriptional regulator [Candidatus Dadabacteria bacterium]NIS09037.1 TetR/AcrR family transcriptional regulator [Candidatus Dadabacteria bacterium]NIX15631.1 TetR family transcriptional regulator [Candidatus Dadabacteria bacterium]NIY22373.1 TetR family transcriptional regulator [Candidatus Dadabacteria bacterium]
MGRHYEFNRDETLSKAMRVFWQKGYKATSIKDLVDEMGIQPGSIYNTFGDKHTLFLESIKHYGDVVTSNTIRVLNEGPSPVENIREFFTQMIERPYDKRCIGCLVVNSVVELAPHDQQTADVVNRILKNIDKAFYDCLQKAQALGEISPESNIKALASYFASCTHGLLVTGKSNASSEQMKDIVEVMLSALI